MKTFKKLTKVVLAVLFSSFVMVSCNENEDEVVPPTTKMSVLGAFLMNNQVDQIDISQLGLIRIYNWGSNSDSNHPLPLTETVTPCKYPNGFCKTQYVTGTPISGGNGGKYEEYVEKETYFYVGLPTKPLDDYVTVLKILQQSEELANMKVDLEKLADFRTKHIGFSDDTKLDSKIATPLLRKYNINFEEIYFERGDYKIYNDKKSDFPHGYIKAKVIFK